MIYLLTATYVFVAALLLSANLSLRWPLAAKLGAIVLVTACYAGTYFGWRAMTGWPTAEPLPDPFRLHWVMVEEPDNASSRDGAIYFWVSEVDGRGNAISDPRSHQMPYDKDLHEAAEDALRRLEGGQTINGYMSRTMMDPDEAAEVPEQANRPDLGQRSLAGDEARFAIEFREVPPPTLPPKPAP